MVPNNSTEVRQPCYGNPGTQWVRDDGGRASAGFQGTTGDCVTRAIAIGTGRPYQEIYDLVNQYGQAEKVTPRQQARRAKANGGRSSARTGVYKPTTKKILTDLGWTWHPTMRIGQGCTVHLRADELPDGTIIAQASKHLVAVIDGVIHDTGDSSRGGTRCVYGYWTPPATA